MGIQERIKSLRVQKSVTQKQLADSVGVSVVSVQGWESGAKTPSLKAAIGIAEFFGVSCDYLFGASTRHKTEFALYSISEKHLVDNYRSLDSFGRKTVDMVCRIERERVESSSSLRVIKNGEEIHHRMIPRFYTPSAAGVSVPTDGYDYELIDADSVPEEADFAVGIQGNSMFPYISDGDTVYVQKNTDIRIGDIGIFCVDGAMYCKQYYIDCDGNLTLVSANPKLRHTNVSVSADGGSSVVCYGKVLGVTAELPEYFLEQLEL